MSATTLLRAIRKWWWTVVALVVIGAAAGFGAGFVMTPVYQSTAQLVVTYDAPAGAASSDLVQANNYAVQKAYAYMEIAMSPRVIEEVIASLGLADTVEVVSRDLSIEAPLNTPILALSADAPTAAAAQEKAQAFVDAFSQTVLDIETPSGGGTAPIRIDTLQEPLAPEEPVSPDPLVNIALGMACGLAVGLIWIAVAAVRDRRVHGAASVGVDGDEVPRVIGSIPARASGSATEVADAPLSAGAEAYRTVAAVLGHMPDTRLDIVAVVPATPRDRSSALTVNLALAMTEFGVRVALVDANLRSGSVTEMLALDGPGLAGVLRGETEAAAALRTVHGVDVLPVGETTQSPAELMSGSAFAALVKSLSESHDMVILDAAPALPLSDTIFAASAAGSTLLAVTAGRATRPQLSAATAGLRAVGIDPVGVVVVDAPVGGVDADPSTSLYRDLRAARA
ncbi:Wzz/FepE/Etk N-terminal domain-containing protein [Microbacterium enclense]|uniref:Wzz/FepE/Etk N-terminal domain-containing protein n=1 Tax=Microbacterium enclense TaxID=993073 RepID=UPI0036DF09A9